ncbi:putative glycosyl hydrolase [Biscogniauxia mediterranea]|nr:putative glycosyl hydrolase [Biscogniauxia mediterranea]
MEFLAIVKGSATPPVDGSVEGFSPHHCRFLITYRFICALLLLTVFCGIFKLYNTARQAVCGARAGLSWQATNMHISNFKEGLGSRASLLCIIVGLLLPSMSGAIPAKAHAPFDYTTAEAGNPFVSGWYADPDTAIYNGLFWVYPTSSYAYEEQTYLDAFSSPDLIHWTKHPNILTIANVTWATKAVWAPAPIYRNGKYYLYFGANDIQEDEAANGAIGGIGVAVADKPEGPYVDAIGKPLIGDYHNGAQPIDQDVFIDDADGQAYIYYGGHSHANVAKLNEDMVSIGRFEDDGTSFKEITPENYVEGSQMIKRDGAYYFMWSEGGWTGPDYSVSYAIADSPLGPFDRRRAKILQQDEAVARGSGHHGVINIPGTDIWYIVYHRRPLSETDGNHRVLAYDRMYFDADGTIAPVRMLVKDDFADGRMIAWTRHGGAGDWSVAHQRLVVVAAAAAGATATLDTDFSDLVFDATVAVTQGSGDAGLVFRTTNVSSSSSSSSSSSNSSFSYQGYYASISPRGAVSLGKSVGGDGGSTELELGGAERDIVLGREYNVRVSAVGSEIKVFVDDMEEPVVSVTDDSFAHGADGVRARDATARFGFISVARPS